MTLWHILLVAKELGKYWEQKGQWKKFSALLFPVQLIIHFRSSKFAVTFSLQQYCLENVVRVLHFSSTRDWGAG